MMHHPCNVLFHLAQIEGYIFFSLLEKVYNTEMLLLVVYVVYSKFSVQFFVWTIANYLCEVNLLVLSMAKLIQITNKH